MSVGDVTELTSPEVLQISYIQFVANGEATAVVVQQSIKITAGLNDTGVIYFLLDDETKSIGTSRRTL